MANPAHKVSELADLLNYLDESERAKLHAIVEAESPIWVPLPGPQTDAFHCQADILYYGGSAGGGKTDLLLGLGLTEHIRTIIYRREATQNIAMQDRLLNEILRDRKGWNGKEAIWRGQDRQIEFGSVKDPGSEIKYQGRPHDLKAFDEITHFLESQFRFLIGWLRGPNPRKRIVCTGNPPTKSEGQWVTTFWAAWLDPKHPNPALPGELRWYTTLDGKDVECDGGSPFEHKGQWVQPLSRTFIPSNVRDNPFMIESGYESILQALPEPLRSQMLLGDFQAAMEDSAWQVMPTAWVEAAMDRWTEEGKQGHMDSCGADIARGGSAQTVISTRHGAWYAPLKAYPGTETPDGATAAGNILSFVRDAAPIHVDVIGVGGSVYDHLRSNDVQVVAINGTAAADLGVLDKASRSLRFKNKRAQLWWQFRESLDPKTGDNIALPPDPELKADLCGPHWILTPQGILIESKEQLIHGPRLHKNVIPLGRSPDKGDAVIYCSVNSPKMAVLRRKALMQDDEEYDPLRFGLGGEE